MAQIFQGSGGDLASDVDAAVAASDAQAMAARFGLTKSFPRSSLTRGQAAIWLAGQLGL